MVKDKRVTATTTRTVASNQAKAARPGIFGKDNYMWMAIGLVVLAIGFFLMAGGKSADPNVFDEKEIYSTVRITIAPLLIIIGFIIEIYAIMKKTKN